MGLIFFLTSPAVFNSWLKRYRDAVSVRLVTDRVFFEVQHKVIRKILERPGLVLRVACNPEDSNQIYAYIVAEFNQIVPDLTLIHWIYVKSPFRRAGVAKDLLSTVLEDHKQIHYTHKTFLTQYLDKDNKWIYNPTFVWTLL